jgi:hypothetical protein
MADGRPNAKAKFFDEMTGELWIRSLKANDGHVDASPL